MDLPYHLYNHKGQPQHRELHALLKVIKIKSSVKGDSFVQNDSVDQNTDLDLLNGTCNAFFRIKNLFLHSLKGTHPMTF